MPVDEITNSGEPAVNFKYSLNQIPFLCVYSVCYKSPWDLKKKSSFKKYIKTQIDRGKWICLHFAKPRRERPQVGWGLFYSIVAFL